MTVAGSETEPESGFVTRTVVGVFSVIVGSTGHVPLRFVGPTTGDPSVPVPMGVLGPAAVSWKRCVTAASKLVPSMSVSVGTHARKVCGFTCTTFA